MVREICAHLTDDEHQHAVRFGALFGLWNAVTTMVPVMLLVLAPGTIWSALALPLLILPVLGVSYAADYQRRFLAGTQFARAKAYRPQDIRLYRWQD